MTLATLAPRINTTTYQEVANKVYQVVLSESSFNDKPKFFKELHKELDHAPTIDLTLYELLEAVNEGRTWKNGTHDYPMLTDNEKEFIDRWAEINQPSTKELNRKIKEYNRIKKKNELKNTRLAVLDVDDVLGKTNPVEVMKEAGAVALYYTFSHGEISPVHTKMNRYRLLFELSEEVIGKEQLEYVQRDIKNKIINKYPYLNTKNYEGKSNGIDNITKMFFGTNKGYEINKDYKTYKVKKLIEEYNKEIKFNAIISKMSKLKSDTKGNTTAEELIEMAQYLGDTNELLDYQEWVTLAIGLWNTAQLNDYPDDLIVEALSILDGHRQNERYYMNFKLPLNGSENQASIGTLIKLATDNGYKRKYRQSPTKKGEQGLETPVTTHYIDEYIDKSEYLKIIENDDRKVLLISDTNSGKTHASLAASREYLKKNKKAFVYIALPAIPLSQQVQRDYKTGDAILGRINIKKEVDKAIRDDTRLLVGTYDKAYIVYEYLKEYEVIVIMDEAHKEISDYNYRYEAIQNLFGLLQKNNLRKFIGMTGTPSELDLGSYDAIEVFKLKEPKKLADLLQFIEYTAAKDYEEVVARACEVEVKNGNKVLAFINNKKVIKKIAKALRMQGLRVATITADNRKSKTYRKLLDSNKFDKDIDIILSTIVISDGINIENTYDYVLMIAPSSYKHANFFNINIIRQAVNRYRTRYHKILIPLYINADVYQNKEHERSSAQSFELENQYHFLFNQAQITKIIIETEFKKNAQYYTPVIAEKLAGLFRPNEATDFNFKRAYEARALKEQGLNYDKHLEGKLKAIEEKLFTIDTRSIRQQASQDKERYYSLYPEAFKKAIKEILDNIETDIVKVDDYFLNNDSSLGDIIEQLEELEIVTEDDKRKNVHLILGKLIYSKIQKFFFEEGRIDESLNEWKLLKNKMNTNQYIALTQLVKFLDYEECLRELTYVRSRSQSNELRRNFQAITEMTKYKMQESETVTERVFKEIEKTVVGKTYYKHKDLHDDLDKLAEEFKLKGRYTIAKRQQIFKNTFNRYFITASSKSVRDPKDKNKVRRQTLYKVLDFQHIANSREIEIAEVIDMFKNYTYHMR